MKKTWLIFLSFVILLTSVLTVAASAEDYDFEQCEYYGIEMIDMTHNSIINRINAETMLPDKVHPSLDAHRQMGLELSGKILYGC
jgi:hypothetical protein